MTAATLGFRPPAPTPREKPLGLFGMIATLRRNPIEIWTRRHYEEPVLFGRSIMGDRAVVSDPAGVRRIFLDNVANYRKDDLQLRILKPGLGEGLLTADDANWRAQRRLLAPLFTPRRIAGLAAAMAASVNAGVERFARCRPGQRVDMLEEMSRLTLEILEHTLFTQGLGRDTSEFQNAVTHYFNTVGRLDPFDLLGLPQFLPRFGRIRGKSTLEWFAGAVDDIIAVRRKMIADGTRTPRDILTLLLEAQDPETGLGMREEDLRSNIVTFIGAGHETTANALTWTFYLLSQSPEWRAEVEAEADAQLNAGPIDGLTERMPVTMAVLEESLRLYPPAAFLSRAAKADDVVCGMKIPAGAIVTVSPFLLHRHKKLWERPNEFDPTRFLGANRERIDRFAYIPFGAGPRICIGMGFAIQEAIIVLAHLVHAFRFDLAPGHVVRPVQRVTLRPQGGMPMQIAPRL
ncbi:MAG: cytochrome P450 [Rhodoblastus sp.]